MTSLDIEERRRSPRQRLGRLATIKLGIGIAPRYCLVSNVSAEGVRIHVNGYEVLDEFVLIFPEGREGQSGTYKVVRLLPSDGDDYQYRIKNPDEAFERVAKESQLEIDR